MRHSLSLGLLLVMIHSSIASADEIKVVSVTATGLMAMMEQLAPAFERATGHRIVTAYDLAPDLQKRVESGEGFDVIILVPSIIDDLTRQGKVVGGMRVDFARTGVGVCVRAGASRPDIGSVEAFKRTLLNAKSLSYNPAVASGRHVLSVFQRLGIAGEMAGKTVSAEDKPGPGKVVGVVARGEAEMGLVITTDIISDVGVEFVGPLPAEVQSYTTFTAAIGERARNSSAAKALLDFLQAPIARSVIEAKGMELPK
jgi:molybdate transport system substrate-binding protein